MLFSAGSWDFTYICRLASSLKIGPNTFDPRTFTCLTCSRRIFARGFMPMMNLPFTECLKDCANGQSAVRNLTVNFCLLTNAGEIFAGWVLAAEICPWDFCLRNRRLSSSSAHSRLEGHLSAGKAQPANISPAFINRQKLTVKFLTANCLLVKVQPVKTYW